MPAPTSRPIQLLRATRLVLHLLYGAATVACVYPFIRDGRRLWIKQNWSRRLLDILGIRLDAQLAGVEPGSLFVANHISWLDIYALNAARPMAFVAKTEVRRWPLVGWLAARTDTVFLRRGAGAPAGRPKWSTRRLTNCSMLKRTWQFSRKGLRRTAPIC